MFSIITLTFPFTVVIGTRGPLLNFKNIRTERLKLQFKCKVVRKSYFSFSPQQIAGNVIFRRIQVEFFSDVLRYLNLHGFILGVKAGDDQKFLMTKEPNKSVDLFIKISSLDIGFGQIDVVA